MQGISYRKLPSYLLLHSQAGTTGVYVELSQWPGLTICRGPLQICCSCARASPSIFLSEVHMHPDLRSMATKRCRSGLLRNALAAANALPNWKTAQTVPRCRTSIRCLLLLRPARGAPSSINLHEQDAWICSARVYGIQGGTEKAFWPLLLHSYTAEAAQPFLLFNVHSFIQQRFWHDTTEYLHD